MPDNAWRDINDPIFLKPKKIETPAADPDDAPPRKVREPPPTEYSITSVRAVEPPHGFEPTKPYDIEGEVEQIGTITQPRIVLHPIGLYQGRESNFVPAGVDAFIDPKTLKFKATCMYLRQPYEYWSDRDRPADATWDLVIRAKGNTAQKSIESEKLTFPQPTKFVVLKKDDYDETGAQKYNKPQSGETFKPRNVVKALQNDLINTGFLPKGADDGYFGDQTDKAVHEFQDYAIKPERMERQIGKLIKTDRKLEQAQPDGIVGKKTRDELDWWLQEGWIKPIESLRYDDYDVEAINKGIKPHRPYGRDASTLNKMRTDDYHEVGTPVLDAQKALAATNAYTGALDGWFGDKMKAAVTLFQEAAEKGEFLIDGVMTDIGEKLTGFRRGVLCPKTKEHLKTVVEGKKGKVEGGKAVKKGDIGEIVEEINIRLAGFGGGPPGKEFDDLTERKVLQFQSEYMKIKKPTGIIDKETAKAIDEFGEKFSIPSLVFQTLECSCGKQCGGFGKKRHKNEYSKNNTTDEGYHKYEYPGIHRSLLWAIRALDFVLATETPLKARRSKFESGYRCSDHTRQTTNHRGKAIDIHFETRIEETWSRPSSGGAKEKTCNEIRERCKNKEILNASVDWLSTRRNCFSLESAETGATSWVHIDTRMFDSEYLADRFFCTDVAAMNGIPMVQLLTKGNR
jgi:peptidoglycan hydrolase-like protein with peptidoglycan-binding domain